MPWLACAVKTSVRKDERHSIKLVGSSIHGYNQDGLAQLFYEHSCSQI